MRHKRTLPAALALLCLVPAAAAAASQTPAAAARASVSLEVDPRIELLSVAMLFAVPTSTAGVQDDYLRDARASFEQASGHPAAARLSALLRRGVAPDRLASLLLQVSAPPALAAPRPLPMETLDALGGKEEAEALLASLRDFAKRTNFGAFFDAHRQAYRAFADVARAESLRAIPAGAAEAYIGRPFTDEHHIILAPLFPAGGADEEFPSVRDGRRVYSLRPRALARNGKAGFLLDTFERSTAISLAAASMNWISPPSPAISIQLAYAVGLRAMAADLGEAAFRDTLRRPALRRYPLLAAVCERLNDYESSRSRYGTLDAFIPVLEPFALTRLAEAERAALAGDRTAALALVAAARKTSADPGVLRRAAMLLQDLKEYAPALELFDALVKAAPSAALPRIDRATLAARMGDRAEVLSSLAAAEKLDPSPADCRQMLLLYRSVGETARTLAPLELLHKHSPEDVGLYIELSRLAVHAGDKEKVVKLLAGARRYKPDAAARRGMASLYQKIKEYRQARELLAELIKESPADPGLRFAFAALASETGDRKTALSSLADARARAPDAATRRLMAQVYQDLKEYGEARGLLEELVKESPQDASLRVNRSAIAASDMNLRIDSAGRATMAGDRETALKILAETRAPLDALIKESPKDPDLRIALAALAVQAGDRKAALLALADARARKPDAAGRRRMAMMYQDLKEFDEATGLLEELLKEAPQDAGLRADLDSLAAANLALKLERSDLASLTGDRAAALALLAKTRSLNPPAEVRRMIARQYGRLGEYAEAQAVFDGLLKEMPADIGLHLERAGLAAQAGDRGTALKHLAEAGRLKPNAGAKYAMATLYRKIKEGRQARVLLGGLIAESPSDPALRFALASAAFQDGDRNGALESLAAARARKPDAATRRLMALLYQDMKADAEARSLFEELIKETPQDASLRVLLTSFQVTDVNRRIDRAGREILAGNREDALKFLAEARALKPNADARRLIAQLYQELKAHDEARSLFEELVREAPQDPRARADLSALSASDLNLRLDGASLAALAGDAPAALKFLAEARGLNPDADARRRMVPLYGRLEQYAEAQSLLDGLIKEFPTDVALRLDRAGLAALTGNKAAARQLLAEARRLDPDAAARRLMAQLYQQIEEYGEARELLEELLSMSPADAGLTIDRAALEARAGDGRAALAFLAGARKLGPDRAALHRMALIQQDLKDYAGAAALLSSLATEKPEADIFGDLGVNEHLAGRTDAAISALKTAIKLDPRALPPYFTLAAIYAARGEFALELGVYESAAPATAEPSVLGLFQRSREEARARARKAPAAGGR